MLKFNNQENCVIFSDQEYHSKQRYQTRFERKHIITLTRFILNSDVEFNGNPMEFVPMTDTNGIRSTIEIYIIIKI